MSVVHQGMPAMPMFSPAASWLRRLSKVEWMSPDQTSAPYLWLPAQAQRTRLKGRSTPLVFSPS